MKELNYSKSMENSVNQYKTQIAGMMHIKPESLKLVGLKLCFAQEDGDFVNEVKLWATKEAADLFTEEDTE